MHIFFQEFHKILRNKSCILALIIALVINIGLLAATNPGEYYNAANYQKAYHKISTLNDDKKGTFIEEYYQSLIFNNINEYKYTHSFMGELELFNNLNKQWNKISSYPDFLTSIKQSSQDSQVAIFKNQSDFQKRNANKTIKDYQGLDNVKLTFTNVNAFIDSIDFAPTDLIALAFIFFIISSLLIYEKEHQLFFLLKSTKKGRTGLITAKTSVILLMSLMTVLLFWGSNIFVSCIKNGSLPLSVSIQSITSFTTSTLAISTGQYLLLFLVSKICIYSLIGMIFLFIALMSKKTIELYFLTILLFGISFTLYLTIPDNSTFTILKYINIIPYLLVNPIYQTYLNLNIIGYPINTITIFWIIISIILPFFTFLNIYVFSKDKTTDTLTSWHPKRKNNFKTNVSIFYHECYKLLVLQKGLIILIIFSITTSWYTMNINHDISEDEYYYKNYMSVLNGPYDTKKQQIIEKETKRFEELHQKSSQASLDLQSGKISENEKNAIDNYVSTQLLSERAFQRVLERVNYVLENPDYPIIYETGYLELFGKGFDNYKTDFTLMLLLILTLIILFTPFIASEYSSDMIKLISVQKNGSKKLFKQKWKLCILISTLCTFITYTPQLVYIIQKYGLSNITASNQAILELSNIVLHVPLIYQIILLYLIRLFMIYITITLIFMISQIVKNTYPALFILCASLAFPLGIGIIDIPFINKMSLNSFFSGNFIINEFSVIHVIILFIFIIIFIILSKLKNRNLFK
ncbi:hypothetical protein [Thomasclavelia cocleata]|uniref:hypothetical protein n=1 Tax=Thomasclavelia cocleata TaxID=69824 RepID=UPI0025746ED9|nr:hypothetical protein [Thomasclavelia cocleata]